VIGAITISPRTRRPGLHFATEVDGYYTTAKVVDFLGELLKRLPGPVTVLWDGGTNHRGPAMREFLRRNPRLRLERLPAYSPHLNPVESAWSWLKWGRLANAVPNDPWELNDWIIESLCDLKHDARLLTALWRRSELPLPMPPAT
jgi:transposase